MLRPTKTIEVNPLMNSFTLNPIFSDNMVLQREKPIKIWGESSVKNTITVSIAGHTTTIRDVVGNWFAILPPLEATNECEVTVSSSNPSDETIIIKNVAIGEVWIAGGQSNMEFSLKYDTDAKESISTSDNPLIRFFDCPKIAYEEQRNLDDFSEFGIWRPCNPINAPYYSAVGYYFAKEIYKSQQVPVGIIGCNWGGTSASAWLDESYLAADKDLIVYLEEYNQAIKGLNIEEYEKAVEAERLFKNSPLEKKLFDALMTGVSPEEMNIFSINDMPPFPPMGPKSFNRPAGLFHTMVKKISGYSARGVIWYQGESDDVKANIYDKLFEAVIRCWRETWQDELSFLFVQLAPFESWLETTGRDFPIVREKQEVVSKRLAKVYMASIMDVGMRYDIHPKNKRTVGERLSLLARGKVYGENIICESPEIEKIKREKDSIIIEFRNVGDEFILKGNSINGLQVLVEEREITAFNEAVEENRICINSKEIDENSKVEIRFAYTPYVEVNLYSSVGLSVKPFRLILE
jgi:sialate O-acetylesterase